MQLSSAFYIDGPVEVVWEALRDLERVAVCVPGFSLQEGGADSCAGTMKVRIGAVTMSYRGGVEFLELDDSERRASMRLSGKEFRGQGTVEAIVTSEVAADGSRTHVTMVTDLAVTGRVAQFGRGIIGDVTDRLVAQFAGCLESKLVGEAPSVSSATEVQSEPPPGAPPAIGVPEEPAPLDLTCVVAGPVARRAVVLALGLVAGVLVIRWARR